MSEQSGIEFFGELKEWSERKLKILEGYLDPFVKILGSQAYEQVYFVDAFAGAGIYEDGAKGSAVRAAELAEKYQLEGKRYRLRCINIENASDNYQNLEKNTVRFGDLVLNLQGTFADNVSRILRETARSPVLCFLDPFGVKGIDWHIIKELIHRSVPTDFWIRFDHSTLFRLAGFYDSEAASADKNLATLADTYGISDHDVLRDSLTGETVQEKRHKAVNLYMKGLEEEFRQARGKGFAAYYPIRSITGQDKYFLVFATGHPRGAIIASELICSAEETYVLEKEEYQARQPRQLSLFNTDPTEDDIFADKVQRLQEAIQENCADERLTRDEIYERILHGWFGKIRSTHMTNALKALIDNGTITLAKGPPSNRKSVFQFR
jgi:three-Cys-motif partner protein